MTGIDSTLKVVRNTGIDIDKTIPTYMILKIAKDVQVLISLVYEI